MMMKSLLLATSILALTAGGAFAQGMNTPGANPAPTAPSNGVNSQGPGSGGSSQSYGTQSSYQGRGHLQRIKEAQRVLKQDGLYKGGIDGKIGPETKTAVTKFQKQNGLHQTARLDPRTMHKLLAQNSSGSMNSSGTDPSSGSSSSTSRGIGSMGGSGGTTSH